MIYANTMEIDRIIKESIDAFLLSEGLVMESPTAEGCVYRGKWYDFEDKIPCMPFMRIGSVIRYGDDGEIFSYVHEMILMVYCYYILHERPPLDEDIENRYAYNKMYEYLYYFHQHLLRKLESEVIYRGRYFTMEDGNIIFVTYEDLSDEEARRMMFDVVMDKGLDPKLCYYQSGCNNNNDVQYVPCYIRKSYNFDEYFEIE